MNKKEMFEQILKNYGIGSYEYLDNGNDNVIIKFDQDQVKGELTFSCPVTLSLFLSLFGLVGDVAKAERFASSTMYLDLSKFLYKRKKDLQISQSEMGSLIVICSFLENVINKKNE